MHVSLGTLRVCRGAQGYRRERHLFECRRARRRVEECRLGRVRRREGRFVGGLLGCFVARFVADVVGSRCGFRVTLGGSRVGYLGALIDGVAPITGLSVRLPLRGLFTPSLVDSRSRRVRVLGHRALRRSAHDVVETLAPLWRELAARRRLRQWRRRGARQVARGARARQQLMELRTTRGSCPCEGFASVTRDRVGCSRLWVLPRPRDTDRHNPDSFADFLVDDTAATARQVSDSESGFARCVPPSRR